MKPDFIGIGPARAATTWLYENLGKHPQIRMALWDKKTHFFDLYYDKGIDWYDTFFPEVPQGCRTGELTETYIFYDDVPERIWHHFPDVKIFTCLRNPVDRAFSAYMHLVRDGVITHGFDQALESHAKVLIHDNLYYDHLKPYFDRFAREQIHVFLFEDVIQDPGAALKSMYAFIGVDDTILPPDYDRIHNPTERPRFPLVNKLLTIGHMKLRDMHIYRYLLPLKDTALMRRLRFKASDGPSPGMSGQTRERLQELFKPQILKLSDLIGRDLSHWMAGQGHNAAQEGHH